MSHFEVKASQGESAMSKSTLKAVGFFKAQFAARKCRKQVEKNLVPVSKLICEHSLSTSLVFHSGILVGLASFSEKTAVLLCYY